MKITIYQVTAVSMGNKHQPYFQQLKNSEISRKFPLNIGTGRKSGEVKFSVSREISGISRLNCRYVSLMNGILGFVKYENVANEAERSH